MHSAVFRQVIVHILVFQAVELWSASIRDNSGIIGTLSYSSIKGRLYTVHTSGTLIENYVYTSGILTDNYVYTSGILTNNYVYTSGILTNNYVYTSGILTDNYVYTSGILTDNYVYTSGILTDNYVYTSGFWPIIVFRCSRSWYLVT